MGWRRRWAAWRTGPERQRLESAMADALARGDHPAAVSAGRRCVELLTVSLGPDDPELAVARYALAAALLASGDAEGAGREGELALVGATPRSEPSRSAILELLASAAERRGDDAALEAHLRSWIAEIEREPHGPDRDLRLATASTRLGLALARAGSADDAWAHLARAVALRRSRLDASSLLLGEALHNAATHRLPSSSVEEAAARFEDAVRIAGAAGDAGKPLLEAALHNLGVLREEQGDDDRARDAWERALAARQERLGKDHPSLRATLVRLARLRERTGSQLHAAVLYQRALDLARAELGDDHEVVRALAAWRRESVS
jgi:tetratricopeptide (TPR) repeat protein